MQHLKSFVRLLLKSLDLMACLCCGIVSFCPANSSTFEIFSAFFGTQSKRLLLPLFFELALECPTAYT